jgi:hypothetical protein
MEINPHHHITETVHDHWHKIAALLLHRLGVRRGSGEVLITMADVKELAKYDNDVAVVIHEKTDGIHLRIVTMAEGEKLAKKELQ